MSDKFLDKIVKKNYNNKLEEILVNKNFSEDVKNTLLSMLYKIENGYKDYNSVKRDTFEKNEYIEKIIKIIDKDCYEIEFIEPKSQNQESVDRENKKIICLPIDNKILYSIAKIQKRNIVVKYLDETIEEAFSYLLNTGNNINIVEPLRDFNGFSWNILVKDIEDLNCNLIYQNIIFLMGNKFVDKWVNNYEPLVDYFDLLQSDIETKYGNELKERIITDLIRLSIKIRANQDEDFKNKLKQKIKELRQENTEVENKEDYLASISQKKKKKEKEIKKIDKMLTDKNILMEEYEKRNKKLPLEKKIFSIRVLKNILKEERKSLLEEIEKYNKMMNPKVFLEQKNILEQKIKYIDDEEDIESNLINLQKEIIKCMLIDIKNTKEKSELINIIYNYRYYSLLPINDKKNVHNVKELKSDLSKLSKCLIKKAIDMKVINQILKDEKTNYDITEKIILSKIISLEDIYIKALNEQENVSLMIFDEEIEDSKMILKNTSKEELSIKINKKVKLFI